MYHNKFNDKNPRKNDDGILFFLSLPRPSRGDLLSSHILIKFIGWNLIRAHYTWSLLSSQRARILCDKFYDHVLRYHRKIKVSIPFSFTYNKNERRRLQSSDKEAREESTICNQMQSARMEFLPLFYIRVVALAARFYRIIFLPCKYLNMNEAKYFNLNITSNFYWKEEVKRRRIIK